MPDQAGGMPGGAVRELRFFHEEHVALAGLGKVIGDRAADRAPADDDDPGVQALAPAASIFTYQRTKASTLYSLKVEYGPGS